MKTKSKPLPALTTDEAAEQFVSTADLSTYDLSGFKPTQFEFEAKAAALNLRLPQKYLDALNAKTKKAGS